APERAPGDAAAGWAGGVAQLEALIAVQAEGELSKGQMDAGGQDTSAVEHMRVHLRHRSIAKRAPAMRSSRNQLFARRRSDGELRKMSRCYQKLRRLPSARRQVGFDPAPQAVRQAGVRAASSSRAART